MLDCDEPAVTSARPSVLAPGLPTVTASGVPGYASESTLGLFAPAATPPAIIARLNAEINKLLAKNEMKAAIHAQGAEPDAMTPARFAEMFRADHARWKSIVEQSGGGDASDFRKRSIGPRPDFTRSERRSTATNVLKQSKFPCSHLHL